MHFISHRGEETDKDCKQGRISHDPRCYFSHADHLGFASNWPDDPITCLTNLETTGASVERRIAVVVSRASVFYYCYCCCCTSVGQFDLI